MDHQWEVPLSEYYCELYAGPNQEPIVVICNTVMLSKDTLHLRRLSSYTTEVFFDISFYTISLGGYEGVG